MKKLYESWALAAKAARSLNIKSAKEYFSRRSEDPNLPSNPHQYYQAEWEQKGGWYGFLKKKESEV